MRQLTQWARKGGRDPWEEGTVVRCCGTRGCFRVFQCATPPRARPAPKDRQFWFFFDDWQQNPAKNAIEYIMKLL